VAREGKREDYVDEVEGKVWRVLAGAFASYLDVSGVGVSE
jgi:hypothetical protein